MTQPGLTTTKAPFIEEVRATGELYLDQPYHLYSEENHETWRRLFARIKPRWQKYANAKFLEGVNNLALDPNAIPRLEDINKFLCPLSGFRSKGVCGYVPTYRFFDSLKNREFPTTITIRDGASLDYLPEPDIFHDVAGHVPMHTDRTFSNVLVRLGEVAERAARHSMEIDDESERLHVVESIIRAMARFFWFTVEFGLMKDKSGGIKVYGSGALSSYGEIEHIIESPNVQRYPFQLEWVINQGFHIDRYQPLVFIVDSFEHLFAQVDRLEEWVVSGKCNDVAPGDPGVSEDDLRSFIEAHAGAK